MNPQEFFLSNGIPVIIQHASSPVGALYWWNKTGSTDEQPHEAGFAHFLEHMLFKDTAAKETGQASTGKTARAIESLGGEINAYTSFDQTVYHVTCSEQYWEKVIDQFGTMAKPQRFLRQDFEREREVILEELRRGQDSPSRQLYEKLFELTYKKHPYGRPVIGYKNILKAATVKTLESFYQRNYVSSQMGIILVGPIQDSSGKRLKGLLKILESRFGSKVISKKQAPSKKRPLEPEESKLRFQNIAFDVQNPELALSYRTVDLKHPDVAAFDVLAGILGMGESSRLYQKLFYEKALVTDCSASIYIPKDRGMFLVSFELKTSRDAQNALDTYFDELQEILKNGVSADELKKVATNIESEKLYSSQTVDGIASRLGQLKFGLDDLNHDQIYLEQIKSVTSADIKRVIKTYLTSTRLSAVFMQPKSEQPLKLDFKKHNTLTSEKTTLKPKKIKFEPEVIQLKNGLKVAYAYRPESPVFSVYLASWGGTRLELSTNAKLWGVSHLLANTWTKGTAQKSSKEISTLIESCAASLNGFSGRNTLGLQMTGLYRDWKPLTSLFLDVLINPSFSEDELNHTKRVTEESLLSIPNHSSQVCSKLFMETLFDSHPYGQHPLGNLEQVKSISREDLQWAHQHWVLPKNSTLSIVGGVPIEVLTEWLNELEQIWNPQNPTESHSSAQQNLTPQPAPTGPRWANAQFNREQTHIILGGLGLDHQNPKRFALRVAQTILGGQSGRLFIELREKKSMAYSVSPINMEGIEPGYFGVYIASAPEKTQDAISGIQKVMQDLVKKGPTRVEMERAINHYLGQKAMEQQSVWSQASNYGLELLYRGEITSDAAVIRDIKKVKIKDVQSIVKKLFVDANLVTVIVS